MNIESSKSIWGYGGQFDGEEGSSLFSRGGGWGSSVPGVIKKKYPEFRSPEVGISGIVLVNNG